MLTVDTGLSFNASEVIRQVDQQQGRSVQMRGGEATEYHRYSGTTREIERLGEQMQEDADQPGQWEAQLAAEARALRPLFNTGTTTRWASPAQDGARLWPNTAFRAFEEAAHYFTYSPRRYVSPGDVLSAALSAATIRGDTWAWIDGAPSVSASQSRDHTSSSHSSYWGYSRRRRNSI